LSLFVIRNRRRFYIGLALLIAALAGFAVLAWPARDRPPVALYSSLPIYWNESASVTDLLDSKQPPPWPRIALERDWALAPLDTLAGVDSGAAGENGSLASYKRLLLAQPRALAPAENVALDDWVRRGGHLLLFADPFLTGDTHFAIGDKRRPQDVVLLSPILSRWGLELRYDMDQPQGERRVAVAGSELPINQAGQFVLAPTDPKAPATCTLSAQGIVADCAIGEGRALIVADAALFEPQHVTDGAETLRDLARRAFSD
jgi:hypothetical protein